MIRPHWQRGRKDLVNESLTRAKRALSIFDPAKLKGMRAELIERIALEIREAILQARKELPR